FPNENLVTAQDILDLHLASATLADMNTVTGGIREDTENTKRALEFEIRNRVNKIIRNIASATANEMGKFPSEEILSNLEVKKKLQPLFEKDPTLKEFLSRDQYSLPLYLQKLSRTLQEETESDLHEEIEFALKYCELGAQYKTWK